MNYSIEEPRSTREPHATSPAPREAPPAPGSHLSPFDAKLRALCADPRTFSEPASTVLRRLVTYEGLVPASLAVEGLADRDLELFVRSAASRATLSRVAPEPEPGETSIRVFYNALGRLHLRPATEVLPDYGERVPLLVIGYFGVPDRIWREVGAAVRSGQDEERRLRGEVDRMLSRLEEQGELARLVDLVDDAVRHVEAVNVYADDQVFSVMEKNSSLIAGDRGGGILEALRSTPLSSWTSAERLCVAGLRALFLSGRSIRFEEFNGVSLTARRLFARLRELGHTYEMGGIPLGLTGEEDLLALGGAVGRAAEQSVGKTWLRYRWVSGITYRKIERVVADQRRVRASHVVPERIRALYEDWLGRPCDAADYETFFTELADAALAADAGTLAMPAGTPAKQPIEVLIQEIVASSVLATQADYGMSSSLRDIRPLLPPEPDALFESMLGLKPKNFYCCVVSRPGLRDELGSAIATDVYRPVQNRMQFNRWHFTAGNFPPDRVPKTRHFYYPPAMPDLAEWADQSHGGHTRAGVRYSIRSPGPDMGEPSLCIGSHRYRGFYDIRVVRTDGAPFTPDEMLMARHHCLWMGVVWRRIVAYAESEAGRLRPLVIHGFEPGDGFEPAPSPEESSPRALERGDEKEPRWAPAAPDDAGTRELERIKNAMLDRLMGHPFLARCRDGTVTLPELRAFLVQHGKYASYFTRYLCALMSNLHRGDDVLRLAENLVEELGFDDASRLPHSRIYAQMLEGMGIRPDQHEAYPETHGLIDTMFMLCRQRGGIAGLAALAFGAEAIVPATYSRILAGFEAHGISGEQVRFFSMHVECDDAHTKTIFDILKRELAASPTARISAVGAAEMAINARMRFFDAVTREAN